MPIEPDPQTIVAWPHQINVPSANQDMFVTVTIQAGGTATVEDLDDVTQDLIDYLQGWPGRDPLQNVTGSKYDTKLYLLSTNNPIPLPDPPEPEPEDRPA